jgi:hypothetical protein
MGMACVRNDKEGLIELFLEKMQREVVVSIVLAPPVMRKI